MEDKFLTAPELAAIQWVNACAEQRQREAQEIQAAIARHEQASNLNRKQRVEVLAAIESRLGLREGDLGSTHRIEFINDGQAARIVPVVDNGASNQVSASACASGSSSSD